MASVVGVTSRLTRLLGFFSIALVASLPLIGLAGEASTFLKSDGIDVFTTPVFIQMLIFGTTYAAIGEMRTSFGISIGIMFLLYHMFTEDGGSYASKYIKDDVVKSVQEKIFSYQQPTVS